MATSKSSSTSPPARTTTKAATPSSSRPATRSKSAPRRVQSGDVVLGNTAPANVTKVAVHNAAHKALTRREVAIASILEHTDDKLEAMQILLSRS